MKDGIGIGGDRVLERVTNEFTVLLKVKRSITNYGLQIAIKKLIHNLSKAIPNS